MSGERLPRARPIRTRRRSSTPYLRIWITSFRQASLKPKRKCPGPARIARRGGMRVTCAFTQPRWTQRSPSTQLWRSGRAILGRDVVMRQRPRSIVMATRLHRRALPLLFRRVSPCSVGRRPHGVPTTPDATSSPMRAFGYPSSASTAGPSAPRSGADRRLVIGVAAKCMKGPASSSVPNVGCSLYRLYSASGCRGRWRCRSQPSRRRASSARFFPPRRDRAATLPRAMD